MNTTKKHNIKSLAALAVFCCFWLFTFLYIVVQKSFEKKISRTTWAYKQAFPQSWNFFTQPAIYNDKLIVILQNENHPTLDSIDVLEILWNEKRSKFNYAKANVWDHIMFRTLRETRERLNNNTLKQFPENESNKRLFNNLEMFGKEMLLTKNTDIKNSSYKILLCTNYTTPFKNHQYYSDTIIELTSNWKQFVK